MKHMESKKSKSCYLYNNKINKSNQSHKVKFVSNINISINIKYNININIIHYYMCDSSAHIIFFWGVVATIIHYRK